MLNVVYIDNYVQKIEPKEIVHKIQSIQSGQVALPWHGIEILLKKTTETITEILMVFSINTITNHQLLSIKKLFSVVCFGTYSIRI